MSAVLEPPERWDEVYDVVVLGSGAGGLSAATVAALGDASCLVLEKCEVFGGGAAISGGVVWVPNHSQMGSLGIEDSRGKAAQYLRRVLGNRARWDLIDAYLDTAPEMVDFMARNTSVQLIPRPVGPDYQSEEEGATPGGRMMDPAAFDGRMLGPYFKRLRVPLPTFLLFGGMMVGKYDVDMLLKSWRSKAAFRHAAGLISRYLRDRLTLHRRGTRLTLGNALAARLIRSALDAGVELRSQAKPLGIYTDGQGAVLGVQVFHQGKPISIRASRGLVLATGGFPGSAGMRKAQIPFPEFHETMAPRTNSGDGITLGLAAGGRLDDVNRDNAFWTPVSVMRDKRGVTTKCPHLITDRSKPGLIAVNQRGHRFVNEASSYHDFVAAMHEAHQHTPTIPAYLICDSRFIRKYGLGLVRPGPMPLSRFIKAGYLFRGTSLQALAEAIGVDPEALTATVDEANRFAVTGRDEAYGKGSTGYNRYLGDPDHRPNPCLGMIQQAPFYAVRIYPGDIGTSLGLRTNALGQVLDSNDSPIPGLFACGNDMNSVMAGAYPSGGITLGPALTFGYIIGRALSHRGASAQREAAEAAAT